MCTTYPRNCLFKMNDLTTFVNNYIFNCITRKLTSHNIPKNPPSIGLDRHTGKILEVNDKAKSVKKRRKKNLFKNLT